MTSRSIGNSAVPLVGRGLIDGEVEVVGKRAAEGEEC
jgi:hypothetical protein